ncbi:hypothetical protein VCHA53O466_40003 [Vibrio chagasii]|nr:hypothetical protein VCHA53O466_40003 [Vibrio chagasii]
MSSSIKSIATLVKVDGSSMYNSTFLVKDIIELLRAPAADAWSDDIQVEGQNTYSQAIEERHGLGQYMAEFALPILEPMVLLCEESDVGFKPTSKCNSLDVGEFSLSDDSEIVVLKGAQQYYALFDAWDKHDDAASFEKLVNMPINVTIMVSSDVKQTGSAFRYLNREFTESQMAEFILNEHTQITEPIIDGDLLRAYSDTDDTGMKRSLVNTKNNSIPARSLALTTKRCIESIHEYMTEQLPNESMAYYLTLSEELWREYSATDVLIEVKENPKLVHTRRDAGAMSVLLRPSGQKAVMFAAIDLIKGGMEVQDIFDALLNIDLDLTSPSVSKYFITPTQRAIATDADLRKATKAIIKAIKNKSDTL